MCAETSKTSCSKKRLPTGGGFLLGFISTLMGSSSVTASPAPIELGIKAWPSAFDTGSSHWEGRTVIGIRQVGDGIPPEFLFNERGQ